MKYSDKKITVYILSGLNSRPSTDGVYLYPSTFIIERLKALCNLGIKPVTFITCFRYSKLIQLGFKMIRGQTLTHPKLYDISVYDKYSLVITTTKWSLMGVLYFKFFAKKVSNIIISKINVVPNTILHVHWSYPHGYIGMLVAKKLNIPYIITTHGGDINEGAATSQRRRKYIMAALNNANYVIFVSQDSLNNAVRLGFNGQCSAVIPNGVDLSMFYPLTQIEAKSRLGIKLTQKHIVGFVGRLHDHKRADKLPIIFKEILKNTPDVEFIVIGTGPMELGIKDECSRFNIPVTFLGQVKHEDMCYWMNLFDVMILPSRTEGWPCVVLEAYACGTPIVGSNVGGIGEAMGGYGKLVDDGDAFEERFGVAVCDMLKSKSSDETNEIIKYAYEYTWEATVSQEVKLYEKVITDFTKSVR